MRFLQLTETAILPTRATIGSAGYDLHADETKAIPPHGSAIIKTGVGYEGMPEDMWLDLRLRSGTSAKRPVLLANGAGVLDSDFEGREIGIILYNRSHNYLTIDKGDKIAQMVYLKYYKIDDETKPTEVRVGGTGSTDK